MVAWTIGTDAFALEDVDNGEKQYIKIKAN
jgi:hypothetical protein